jgi:twitching motility protein PilT
MRIASRRLGEFLVDRRVLSRDILENLLAREAADGVPLPQLLLVERLVGESDLVAAIASELGVPFLDIADRTILSDAWRLLPEALVRRYSAVPVERGPEGVLVAMADPSDVDAVREISAALGAPVLPGVAVPSDLETVIEQMYGSDGVEHAQARGLKLDDLLRAAMQLRASDLHLTVGSPPMVRVLGELTPLPGFPSLNGSDTRQLVLEALTRRQRDRFDEEREIATSYSVPGVGRFRVGAFVQRDSVGAVLRAVPQKVPALGELGLPPSVEQLAMARSGLVLVNGSSGSGTSTTLAAMVDAINRERTCHVLTIEDPIEFLHQHQRAIVNQREVGEDSESFAAAMRQVRRHDPDVLLVGELPDLETIRRALAAAESGTLVLATVRSRDAVGSLDRLVDVFPLEQQRLVRVQLASVLRGCVVQQLVPSVNGGRVVVCEVLIGTPEVRQAIVDNDTGALGAYLNARLSEGLQSMDRALAAQATAGRITREVAIEHSMDASDVEWLLSSDQKPRRVG